MVYELRENSGSLFVNRKKDTANKPDFTGEAKVGGVVYWLSAWEKEDKSGKPWFSIALKEKDFTEAKEAAQKEKPMVRGSAGYGDDGEIPF